MYIWAKTKSACRLITENGTNTTSVMWPRQNQALIHLSLHQSTSLYYFPPLSLCFSGQRRNSCDASRISHLAFILESGIFPFGEENGSSLQYSCLENPRDRGAWWAAVYGVSQRLNWLKWLSSSSSSNSSSSREKAQEVQPEAIECTSSALAFVVSEASACLTLFLL